MSWRAISSEVFVTDEPVALASRAEVELLKQQVLVAPRGRVRLCAHPDSHDRLHEMIIALRRSGYIRPHKHLNKSESFHLIEGCVDVVLFDDAGQITRVLELGDAASGRPFFYRLGGPVFHTLILRTELLVMHETTNGPFQPGDAVMAPWAPDERDTPAAQAYQAQLEAAVAARKGG